MLAAFSGSMKTAALMGGNLVIILMYSGRCPVRGAPSYLSDMHIDPIAACFHTLVVTTGTLPQLSETHNTRQLSPLSVKVLSRCYRLIRTQDMKQ